MGTLIFWLGVSILANIFLVILLLFERTTHRDLKILIERQYNKALDEIANAMMWRLYEQLKTFPTALEMEIEEAKKFILQLGGARNEYMHLQTKSPVDYYMASVFFLEVISSYSNQSYDETIKDFFIKIKSMREIPIPEMVYFMSNSGNANEDYMLASKRCQHAIESLTQACD